MAPRILIREDPEFSEHGDAQRFRAEGVDVLVNHKAKQFVVENGEKVLIASTKAGRAHPFDAVLVAVGPGAEHHRLRAGGTRHSHHPRPHRGGPTSILQTRIPTSTPAATSPAPTSSPIPPRIRPGTRRSTPCSIRFKKFKADYSVIPWATFTDPEVARVGLNEQEAKEKGIPYEVTVYGIDDLDRAIADGEAHGVVKVLTVPGKDRILGVTIVGEHAGDLLAEYVLAMRHGIGLNKILGTIHIYPTLAEANKYAAGVWKKAHAPEKLLAWVERFHAWRGCARCRCSTSCCRRCWPSWSGAWATTGARCRP
jgi:hypothetical protein